MFKNSLFLSLVNSTKEIISVKHMLVMSFKQQISTISDSGLFKQIGKENHCLHQLLPTVHLQGLSSTLGLEHSYSICIKFI